jgi:uncharacterized membrane protein SpoIIM required for sporulation
VRQQPFESERVRDWERFRGLLDALERTRASGARSDPMPDLHDFPGMYRRICADYALARSRGYSPGLIDALHDLVRRGYGQLYRRRPRIWQSALGFMARDFPATLRRRRGLVGLAAALLFLPMLAMGIASWQDQELILSVMDAEQVSQLESSYDPANRKPGRGLDRQADTDFAMFGFYILNNIGIGFRTFAGGLVLGLGSVLILALNGLFIGAAAGHLTRLDFGSTFWSFVSGHAPYELTAIAVSGAAGLLLGQALIAPGRRTRLAALRANARDAVILVGGAALMLLLAAAVEAFWSGGGAPVGVKYGVGILGWVLVALYFGLAGRTGGGPRGDRDGS